MTVNRILLAVIPATIMIAAMMLMPGIERWLAAFGRTAQTKLMLGRIGLALPYITAAAIGTIFLFAANGAANIRAAGWGVVSGSVAAIFIAAIREAVRLASIAWQRSGRTVGIRLRGPGDDAWRVRHIPS